jgi:hypothetical protein
MEPRPQARGECRIEHRGPHGKTVLADRAVLLAPLAAWLEAEGQAGELVLVDAASGAPVVRWPLAPSRERGAPSEPRRGAA